MVLTCTWGVQSHAFLLEEAVFWQHSRNVFLSCRRIWDATVTILITLTLVRPKTHSSRSAYAVWSLADLESSGGSHISNGLFCESLVCWNPPRHQLRGPAAMLTSLLSAWVCWLWGPSPPNSLWPLEIRQLHLFIIRRVYVSC